jgi:succinate dehydrogenase hydrophobic anchor subunit
MVMKKRINNFLRLIKNSQFFQIIGAILLVFIIFYLVYFILALIIFYN